MITCQFFYVAHCVTTEKMKMLHCTVKSFSNLLSFWLLVPKGIRLYSMLLCFRKTVYHCYNLTGVYSVIDVSVACRSPAIPLKKKKKKLYNQMNPIMDRNYFSNGHLGKMLQTKQYKLRQ